MPVRTTIATLAVISVCGCSQTRSDPPVFKHLSYGELVSTAPIIVVGVITYAQDCSSWRPVHRAICSVLTVSVERVVRGQGLRRSLRVLTYKAVPPSHDASRLGLPLGRAVFFLRPGTTALRSLTDGYAFTLAIPETADLSATIPTEVASDVASRIAKAVLTPKSGGGIEPQAALLALDILGIEKGMDLLKETYDRATNGSKYNLCREIGRIDGQFNCLETVVSDSSLARDLIADARSELDRQRGLKLAIARELASGDLMTSGSEESSKERLELLTYYDDPAVAEMACRIFGQRYPGMRLKKCQESIRREAIE